MVDRHAPSDVVGGCAVGVSGEDESFYIAAKRVQCFQRGGKICSIGESGGLEPGESVLQVVRGVSPGEPAAGVQQQRVGMSEQAMILLPIGCDTPG